MQESSRTTSLPCCSTTHLRAVEDANLRLRGMFGDVDFANQERFPDARLERLSLMGNSA